MQNRTSSRAKDKQDTACLKIAVSAVKRLLTSPTLVWHSTCIEHKYSTPYEDERSCFHRIDGAAPTVWVDF